MSETETTPPPETTPVMAAPAEPNVPQAEQAQAEPGTPAKPSAAAASPDAVETARELKALFPALFTGPAKPLKLRIQADIQTRAPGRFGKAALATFFRRHTGSTSYLIAMTRSPHRFDLDGQPAGEITEEHRQVAQQELARRRENQQARQELEDQQRRNRAGLLRDFQGTTLTKANFCALKGVPLDELDGLLEIARRELAERPVPAPGGRPHPRHEGRAARPEQGDRRPGPPQGPRGQRQDRREGGAHDARGPKGPPRNSR